MVKGIRSRKQARADPCARLSEIPVVWLDNKPYWPEQAICAALGIRRDAVCKCVPATHRRKITEYSTGRQLCNRKVYLMDAEGVEALAIWGSPAPRESIREVLYQATAESDD